MDMEQVLYMAQDAILGVLIVVSLAVFFVALLSYHRTRLTRILLVTAGFAAIFVKSLIWIYMVYTGALDTSLYATMLLDLALIMELVAVVLIYAAIFR